MYTFYFDSFSLPGAPESPQTSSINWSKTQHGPAWRISLESPRRTFMMILADWLESARICGFSWYRDGVGE